MHNKKTCGVTGDNLRKAVALSKGWYNIQLSDWGEDGAIDWGGVDKSRGCCVRRIPRWTTNYPDAFDLVDEMNKDKRYLGVNLMFHDGRWEASIDKRDDCDGELEVCESLCVAICRLYFAYKTSQPTGANQCPS